MMKVDLNCDLGEAFGNYSFGGDKDIIPLITSANIACGFHAGDENVMNQTVKLAKRKSCEYWRSSRTSRFKRVWSSKDGY